MTRCYICTIPDTQATLTAHGRVVTSTGLFGKTAAKLAQTITIYLCTRCENRVSEVFDFMHGEPMSSEIIADAQRA